MNTACCNTCYIKNKKSENLNLLVKILIFNIYFQKNESEMIKIKKYTQNA